MENTSRMMYNLPRKAVSDFPILVFKLSIRQRNHQIEKFGATFRDEDAIAIACFRGLVAELLLAGTNTTTSMVTWAMSELVRHQEIKSKIEEEMQKEINTHEITNTQLSKLNYLQAFIKETFRLNPPVPLLLPHMAVETCEVMDYKIPKNSKIFVNVWAMGRDPEIWDEPLSFKPERFLDSKHDFKGQDFEPILFSLGRMMCPGWPSGFRSLEFILTSLIREFDWTLPNGDNPLLFDMNEKFGMALHRVIPLKLILKQKHLYQCT
ncbi:hypothetical protein R6Q57_024580 [Mikania cordata]